MPVSLLPSIVASARRYHYRRPAAKRYLLSTLGRRGALAMAFWLINVTNINNFSAGKKGLDLQAGLLSQ